VLSGSLDALSSCLLLSTVLCWCVLQPGEDPFTLLRQEKRERIKGQQKQQLANVKQAMKSSGPASVPSTLRLAAALPTKGKGKPNKRKELRDEVSQCGGRVCWCTRPSWVATAVGLLGASVAVAVWLMLEMSPCPY
jgi:hypothetical protein